MLGFADCAPIGGVLAAPAQTKEEYMQSRFQFEQLNSGDRTTSEFSTDTWVTAADRFFDFLRGCGFELTRQDMADHFDQSCFDRTVDEMLEEHGDALGKLDDRPEGNYAERHGLQPLDE